MDEFRKPYEYDEEKRGLILLFVILLLSVDIIMAISYLVQVARIARNSMFQYGFVIFGITYMAFLLYTAATCYKLKYYMVKVSKIYLIIRIIYMIISIVIVYLHASKEPSMISNGAGRFRSMGELVFTICIGPLIYLCIFSFIWFMYFSKSKRCKEISMKGKA